MPAVQAMASAVLNAIGLAFIRVSAAEQVLPIGVNEGASFTFFFPYFLSTTDN